MPTYATLATTNDSFKALNYKHFTLEACPTSAIVTKREALPARVRVAQQRWSQGHLDQIVRDHFRIAEIGQHFEESSSDCSCYLLITLGRI